ncbi:MAG: ribosome-associated translation inhibitor RaiA [Rickettsiaceae bacterium]|nr:ribosome-associated translation inhibitor RaiA [Rickettsiaceae bacterium]
MQIQISGQHLSIGQKLQTYVKDKTTETVTTYFSEAPSAHIYFSKNSHHITCDIIVNEGTGRHNILKSNAVCDDIYSAYDQSLAKLQKQLRKYKSKLNDYSKKIKISQVEDAIHYTINSSKEEDHESEFNVDNPAIIAEMPSQIPTLSVGEAVMEMDLKNLPTLMFKNIKTNKINVVYYRSDGNISWVDPKSA